MTPEQAVQMQIERYRAMTPEERVRIALGLHELACEMARLGIRHQNPIADEKEVDRLLREGLALAQQI